jgi:hypothetical protein
MSTPKPENPPVALIQGTTPPAVVVFATEADAERYVVSCVKRLQQLGPVGRRGRSVSKSSILRMMAVEHAGIDLDSLDRYLLNLLSDGRLGVTAGRWWVRRAAPVLVLGLFLLLAGCGSDFSTAEVDGTGGSLVTAGGAGLPSAGTPSMAAGGATLASAGAPPVGTGGAAVASAGAPPVAAGAASVSAGAASVSAGAASVSAGGASAGAPAIGTGGAAGNPWPACLASGCGSACRTLTGAGWCEVMARCLTDHGCIASDQPNCTDCSALPDGIDCECAP